MLYGMFSLLWELLTKVEADTSFSWDWNLESDGEPANYFLNVTNYFLNVLSKLLCSDLRSSELALFHQDQGSRENWYSERKKKAGT